MAIRDPRRFRGRASLGGLGGLLGGAFGAGEIVPDYVGDMGPSNVPTYRAKSPFADAVFNRGSTGAMASQMNYQSDLARRANEFTAAEAEKERAFRAEQSESDVRAKAVANSIAAQEAREQERLKHELGVAGKFGMLDPNLLRPVDPIRARGLTAQAESDAQSAEYILGNQEQINPAALQSRLGELFTPVAKNYASMATPVPAGGMVVVPPVGGYSDQTLKLIGPKTVGHETVVIDPITKMPKTVKSEVAIPGSVTSEDIPLTDAQRDARDKAVLDEYNRARGETASDYRSTDEQPRGSSRDNIDTTISSAPSRVQQLVEEISRTESLLAQYPNNVGLATYLQQLNAQLQKMINIPVPQAKANLPRRELNIR